MSIEQRLRRLEDREDIKTLAIMYGVIMDERDFEGIRRIFTTDGILRSEDGVFNAEGLDSISDTYQERFNVLGATNHVLHSHVIRFSEDDKDSAKGFVTSHAEVSRRGDASVVALRYQDKYRRTDVGWQISFREMSYMYYVGVDDYGDAIVSDDRIRIYGDKRLADWPEKLTKGESPAWIKDYLP
jgi:hypothetical protein